MRTPTVYRCPRCRCQIKLYITPSEPPRCAHGAIPVMGHRPAVMVLEEQTP